MMSSNRLCCLGSMIPFFGRAKFDSDSGRVTTWLAEPDPIWPVRVISGLETRSLPSLPVTKLNLPKMNSLPGMKVMALMLKGAIKLDELILTTPPTKHHYRCFFTSNTIYGVDHRITS